MAWIKKIRALFQKKKAKEQKVEYVETPLADQPPEDALALAKQMLGEVDFSRRGDLETYVRELTVPRQVIERWISAGLLFPEEMIMAEKMVKIMIKLEQEQGH